MKTSGRGKPSLSFSTGPKLPDAPSKRFKPFKPFKPLKPLETCQTGYWSCQTKPSGSVSCAKLLLQAVASQVFLFLLARLAHALSKPCKPLKLSKRATAAVGAVASQVVSFLVNSGKKLAGCSPNPANPSNSRNVPQRLLELQN